MVLPTIHPLRGVLHNEVHARPPEAMVAPLALSHVVMVGDAAVREASRAHLAALLREHHLPEPAAGATHLRLDVAGFRIRWELHTEFVSWTFSRPIDPQGLAEPEPPTAAQAVPQDWLAALPGQCLAALHLWALPTGALPAQELTRQLLREESLVGSRVVDGQGAVYTDFAIHADGYARMVLLAEGITARRLGRLVQRLLEIETYRMAALLGLPAARESAAVLGVAEDELASLAEAIRVAGREQEPQLLDRLTRLAGQVESHYAATHSRFSASAAYFELVDARVQDIHESRLDSLQTIGEFIERRLSPARATCAWSVRRQDALSQRVSRISNLLRTRVEIEQQQSSQALLATMNQRQDLQLKLQATVEGLSVAAITYYIVGLVSHLAEGAHAIGWPFSAEATAACAIPVVALAVWLSLRRLHARLLGH
ncbi:MAG: DUF3422 domain-containing protein [Burkholderiales bacterium]|nr:DUF3422 domain-containing protein [Burkholderiales bacterium]